MFPEKIKTYHKLKSSTGHSPQLQAPQAVVPQGIGDPHWAAGQCNTGGVIFRTHVDRLRARPIRA